MSIEEIQNIILIWGETSIRDFIWRSSNDPYILLLSELLLQRTRAVQVNNFIKSFIVKYPSFYSITSTSYDELYSDMKTLGLNWRINNVKKCAEIITKEYHGNIPNRRADLEKLPGVGDYIAGAYLICRYNTRTYALDTNTVRIIGRLFGLPINDSSRRSNLFKQKMVDLMPNENVRPFFYVLLDFSFIQCTGKTPNCLLCPLKILCKFIINN